MDPIEFDGMTFGPAEIASNREVMIVLRDAALGAGNFDYAVPLSHNIAILAAVIERMQK